MTELIFWQFAIAAMLVGRSSSKGWGGILPGAELKAANVFEYNEELKWIRGVTAYEPTSQHWWKVYAKVTGFEP